LKIVLAGGGLANSLLAYRLKKRRPELELLLLEEHEKLGIGRTWSFHGSDIEPAQKAWLAPFIAHEWPHYDVAFPELSRRLNSSYCTISGARFHQLLSDTLGEGLRLSAPIRELTPHQVILQSGEIIKADSVIDGRGFASSPFLQLGFQKFLGLELEFSNPHGLTGPIVMDATVSQQDGYRFIYILPFSPTTALIEDTYYSDDAGLDESTLRQRIHAYAAAKGWVITQVIAEEKGVLPITLDGDIHAFWKAAPANMPLTGLKAGLFHPTTGYSLPDAVRLADLIAGQENISSAALARFIQNHAIAQWQDQRFFRFLNRMLFLAAQPDQRYAVLRRFYTLPEHLIQRFYKGALLPQDKFRILAGKPPVPLFKALKVLMSSKSAS
jgi:lycopene beta-cyclase